MSALARYFKHQGMDVAGYDKTPSPLTDQMIEEGIEISFDASPEAFPERILNQSHDRVLMVYTPAIPLSHEGMAYVSSLGYELLKRSEVLGLISKDKQTYAVAGTHGKTTTSSILAYLLSYSEKGTNAFLGGIATDFNSNLVLASESDLMVVEADEYDRSFLRLNPHAAIITSIDADHLDIYGSPDQLISGFEEFANLVHDDGLLLLREGIQLSARAPIIKYAVESLTADLTTKNLRVEEGAYMFNVILKGDDLGEVRMTYPGRHNVENALAAIGLALHTGLDWESIERGIESFSGVKRRFEYHIRRDDRVFIDDYAHHPSEIDACVDSARELYPESKITGVFQPHLYSRTRDFADDFAKSLEALNDLLLMEIYPAREEPIEGVNSEMLLNKVRMVNKKLVDRENIVEEVLRLSPEVLLTMGAGDIDRLIEPIKNALDEKDK